MGVAEFVAGVDRLLTRAHELYPSEGAAGRLTGGGAAGAVPGVPGSGALSGGASEAGTGYQRSQASAGTLDQALEQAAGQGTVIAEQGRTGSGAILEQARTFASSAGPLGSTAAGARLVVATMDEHMQAMQGQLQQTRAANQAVSSQLREVAAGYQTLAGGEKDAPAVPLDSQKLKPGQKHRPYIAGPGQFGPPNYPDSPRWVDVYDRTQDPDKVPHAFIPSDEIPHYQELEPGALGPSTRYDEHGNPDRWVELAPNSGVWVPSSDFPGSQIMPRGWQGDLPPYGWEEYLPGSGIYMWHSDLLPGTYQPPGGSSLPPATYPQGGH